jgi:hypothetical protein
VSETKTELSTVGLSYSKLTNRVYLKMRNETADIDLEVEVNIEAAENLIDGLQIGLEKMKAAEKK